MMNEDCPSWIVFFLTKKKLNLASLGLTYESNVFLVLSEWS